MVAEPSPSYSSGSLPRFFFESRRHIGGVASNVGFAIGRKSPRAFAVILVRVVTSYFFESRRHSAASRR